MFWKTCAGKSFRRSGRSYFNLLHFCHKLVVFMFVQEDFSVHTFVVMLWIFYLAMETSWQGLGGKIILFRYGIPAVVNSLGIFQMILINPWYCTSLFLLLLFITEWSWKWRQDKFGEVDICDTNWNIRRLVYCRYAGSVTKLSIATGLCKLTIV